MRPGLLLLAVLAILGPVLEAAAEEGDFPGGQGADAPRPRLGLLASDILTGRWLQGEVVEARAEGEALPETWRRLRVDVEVVWGRRRERFVLTAQPGHRVLAACTAARRFLVDYAVELACDNSGGDRPSAVGDPEVETLAEGIAVDVRPSLLPDGRIAFEAAVQLADLDDPVEQIETEARFLGRLDLPACRGALAFVSGVRPAGIPLEVELTAPGDEARIRLVGTVEEPPGPATSDRPCPASDPGAGSPPWEAHRLPAPRPGAVVAEIPYATSRRSLPGTSGESARVEIEARAGGDLVARACADARSGRPALLRFGRDRALLLEADPEVG